MMPRPVAVAAVAVLFVASACAGGDATSTDSGGTASATTPGGTGTATTGGTGTPGGTTSSTEAETTDETDGDDGFEYVPWGPDDPPVPGHYAAMAASPVTSPRCDDVADRKPDAPFWTTVVDVCRALSEGGPWPGDAEVPEPPPPENAYIACVDEELSAMLERALRWHADNPGREPRVRYPAASVRSPCQARIYDVRVLGVEDLREGEDHPDGVGLAVTGASMLSVVDVSVDGAPVERTGDFDVPEPGGGLTTVVVLAPRSATPRTAEVRVRTETDVLTARVDLPAEPGDEATATDPPTAADPPPTADPPTTTDAATGAPTGALTDGATP